MGISTPEDPEKPHHRNSQPQKLGESRVGYFESLNFIDLTVNTGSSLSVSWASHSEASSTETYTSPSRAHPLAFELAQTW